MSDTEFPSGCALVFGGSGGLGRTTAQLLARHGSDVVIAYRDGTDRAANVVADIERQGWRAIPIRCDIKDRSSLDEAVRLALQRMGRIHSVILAYGARHKLGSLHDMPPEEVLEEVEFETIGFLNATQATLPALRSGGGGSITAITSPGERRAIAQYGHVIAAKTALAALVRALALEEGPNNVRVNAVGPGVIGTPAVTRTPGGDAFIERAIASVPMRRVGTPSEVAEMLVFLASSKASYVTGQVIMIDGGYSL